MERLDFKEIMEGFFQMEDELDLFDQQIDGVYFWERIRFPLYQRILRNSGVIGQAHMRLESTTATRGIRILRAVENAFVKNPYLAPKSEILFFGFPRRKLRSDGKWWDIYCDPIIERLEESYVYFEPLYLNKHLMPVKTDNIRYLDLPFWLAAVRCKLNLVRVSVTNSERKLLADIQEQIGARFNVPIDLEKMVEEAVVVRKIRAPIYRALLDKVRPKLAIVVCSYGKETFIETCKSLGIPVVELQHGVISPYHLGYSFPGPKRIKRTFPDYLFAFGGFWRGAAEYPIGKERIYSVGYPYLEDEAKRYIGVKKKDQVVFISQGTIGKAMSRFAVRLRARSNFPLEIVYKLHPGEYGRWRKEYPWLAEADVRVIDNENTPLYQLLAESKVQVGVNSTAIFEGLNFGLRTFLLDLPGVEYMDYLVSNGTVLVVKSPEELAEKIWEEPEGEVKPAYFFEPDALNNVKGAIRDLLDGEIDKGNTIGGSRR